MWPFKKITKKIEPVKPTTLDLAKRKAWAKAIEHIKLNDVDNAEKWLDLFIKIDRFHYI